VHKNKQSELHQNQVNNLTHRYQTHYGIVHGTLTGGKPGLSKAEGGGENGINMRRLGFQQNMHTFSLIWHLSTSSSQ